jgi:hypothetical protein
MNRVQTEQDAYVLLEELRWGGRAVGPHCGSDRRCFFLKPEDGSLRKTRTGSLSARRVWKYGDCRKQFSVLTGTIFHGTKISVRTWFFVILELVSDDSRGLRGWALVAVIALVGVGIAVVVVLFPRYVAVENHRPIRSPPPTASSGTNLDRPAQASDISPAPTGQPTAYFPRASYLSRNSARVTGPVRLSRSRRQQLTATLTATRASIRLRSRTTLDPRCASASLSTPRPKCTRPPEKRKVGGSTPPLPTTPTSHFRRSAPVRAPRATSRL